MLSDIEQIIADCGKFEGIAPNLLNKLNPTVTGLNTVQIDTGSALNDGHPYKNSTTVAVNIPSAVGGGNTRIDRIVARCSWAGFTVRIFRIAGTDAASPTVPAIVQTPGTTYDIKICQVLVNTAGTCTVTDERTWAGGLPYRQGGNAGNWATPGSTTYTPTGQFMQVGTVAWSGAAASSGNVAVTFPAPYNNQPIAFVNYMGTDNILSHVITNLTGLAVYWRNTDGSNETSLNFNWLVVGPS